MWLELPIDHFRLLGISPSAETEEILRSFQLRLDRPPKEGFTYELLGQRAELLRRSADLLADAEERKNYENALLQGSIGLEVSSNRDVAGMLLLWEAKSAYEAFKLAKKALQPPQTPALGSGREADLTLIAALSCRDAAIDEQEQRHYSYASELLQEGIKLLQRMGKLPEERKSLEEDLELLLPYRILDLLSREIGDEVSRQEGIGLLNELVIKRGGLEGKNRNKKLGGLSQQDFELFFQQIRGFLTVQEQVDLFHNWNRRGSVEAGFLCAIALVASGYSSRKPERLQEARKFLKNLNVQGLDSMPLFGCIDLLLADIKQAEARFKSSSDSELKTWLETYPGEILAALCDYCRNWLVNDVLPGYRDVNIEFIDLEAWFADRDVQSFVERLEQKGALGIAKSSFSFLSSRSSDQNNSKDVLSNQKINDSKDSDLPMPGGLPESFDENIEKEEENVNDFSYFNESKNSIKDSIAESLNKLSKIRYKEYLNRVLSNQLFISASVFFIIFVTGTLIGIVSLRPRNSNKSLVIETPVEKNDLDETTNKGIKESDNLLLVEAEKSNNSIDLIVEPVPTNDQIQSIVKIWLDGKSKILLGENYDELSQVVRKGLYERLLLEREKDKKAGEWQIINADIRSIDVESKTKKRISVKVNINYRDTRMSTSGSVLTETVIPSLKVRYILGREKQLWKVVDYISGV